MAPAEEARDSLRAAVLALRSPHHARRAAPPDSSPFARACVTTDAERGSRARAESAFRSAETTALLRGTTLAVVLLPYDGDPDDRLSGSLRTMARSGTTVVVLGPGVTRRVAVDGATPHGVPLRRGDVLHDEWALLALGPQRRLAFLARAVPGTAEWDWVLTRDEVAVLRAGTALLERAPHLRLRVPPLDRSAG